MYVYSVETINGTALAVEDYKPFSEDVPFAKNEELRQVFIEIVDDFEWEPDEFFFVKLTIPEKSDGSHEHVALGNVSINQVTIINDDGRLGILFATQAYLDRLENVKKIVMCWCAPHWWYGGYGQGLRRKFSVHRHTSVSF